MTGKAVLLLVLVAGVLQKQAQPPQSRAESREPSSAAAAGAISDGDQHYGQRQEGHSGALADSREILAAIGAYESGARSADQAEARWKLARALYFRGVYTGLDADARRMAFEKARSASEEGMAIVSRRAQLPAGAAPARIAAAVRGDPDAAATFFWGSVSWGEWALSVGKMEAVKAGAAAKIRDTAATVIAIDPRFEDGGGYRILGRLHAEAPKIPMLTWWVSRKDALANLRLAVSVAPDNPINLHFLAEVLARGDASEREEAIRLEEKVLTLSPSPDHVVEELRIQEGARRDLAAWRKV